MPDKPHEWVSVRVLIGAGDREDGEWRGQIISRRVEFYETSKDRFPVEETHKSPAASAWGKSPPRANLTRTLKVCREEFCYRACGRAIVIPVGFNGAYGGCGNIRGFRGRAARWTLRWDRLKHPGTPKGFANARDTFTNFSDEFLN